MLLRRRSAAVLSVTAVASAGLGAVVATTVAGAADTPPPNYREAVACAVTVPVAPPADRRLSTKITVSSGQTVNGTIPVPTTYKDPVRNITFTATQWKIEYGADGLGKHGKIGAFGAKVAGGLTRDPISIDLPTNGHYRIVAASANPAAFSFTVSGPVSARATISTYLVGMTATTVRMVPGKSCPAGTTVAATVDPNGAPDPSGAPSASTSATPTPSSSPSDGGGILPPILVVEP
ncbi:MAG TPA: hypothetical protein VHE83_17410 [Mycobacteriales bacterium]|nr:hypothetical protein [Mycobacteriales bacterium]